MWGEKGMIFLKMQLSNFQFHVLNNYANYN